MIVSVHVPKTGGSTVGKLLAAHFGAIRRDYGDGVVDPDSAFNRDRLAYCAKFQLENPSIPEPAVHGHFWPNKYSHVGGMQIAFLRDPRDRLLSNYFHWMATPANSPFRARMRQENATVLDFARQDRFRFFYVNTYFGGVDMQQFAFVGLFENLISDVQRLQNLLGASQKIPHEQRNPHEAYLHLAAEARSDSKLMAALTDLLAKDLRFYEQFSTRR